jgi:hypothetical protein
VQVNFKLIGSCYKLLIVLNFLLLEPKNNYTKDCLHMSVYTSVILAVSPLVPETMWNEDFWTLMVLVTSFFFIQITYLKLVLFYIYIFFFSSHRHTFFFAYLSIFNIFAWSYSPVYPEKKTVGFQEIIE